MKTALGIFAAGVVLLVAASAWAQTTTTLPTGTTTTTLGCVPPDLVADVLWMGGPNGMLPGDERLCERFCKDFQKLCRNLTGVNRLCLRKLIRGANRVADDICKDIEDREERRECLDLVDEFVSESIWFIEEAKHLGSMHCDEDYESCLDECEDD